MTGETSLKTWLRLEALFVFALLLALYAWTGASWGLFALLFLVPDLAMLGYLANPGIGAFFYNLAHAYAGPAMLMVLGLGLSKSGQAPDALQTFAPYALIWAAHIAFDRVLGYGLKSPEGFKITHLGRIGHKGTEK